MHNDYNISFVCVFNDKRIENILLLLKTIGNELQNNNVILLYPMEILIFIKPFLLEIFQRIMGSTL